MYAIFESGSKQFKATVGDELEIDRLGVTVGETLELNNVLMIVDDDKITVGTPNIENAAVIVRVVGNTKGNKITVFKFKKRKNVRCKTGHRQKYIKIQVDEIRPGI